MTGYADEPAAAAILQRDGVFKGDADARTQLADLNADLSVEIDNHVKRGAQAFTARGTTGAPIIWTVDAPLGSVLPLPDFAQVVQVLRNSVDVTTQVRTLVTTPVAGQGPPYQALLYLGTGGVPTSWDTGLTAAQALGGVTVKVVAGWPAVPGPVAQTATELLCRVYRAQVAQYSGSAGDAFTSVPTGPPYLDMEGKCRLAPYVRPRVPIIRGGT